MPSAPYRSPIAIAPKGSLAQFASLIERPANDAAPKAGRLGMEPGRHEKATPPHKDTRAERLPMEATRASPPPRGAPSKAPSSLHLTREVLAIFGQEEPVTPHPREAYRGVAVSALEQHGEVVFHIALRHHEAERSVALAHGTDVASVARAWHAWAQALALPLLAEAPSGAGSARVTALGKLLVERGSPRRRGSALVGRRSRYARRRRSGVPLDASTEPLAGREIIART